MAYNIVNFQDAPNSFSGEIDDAGRDQQRLHNILFQNICNASLPYIDSSSGFTLSMAVPQFCYS